MKLVIYNGKILATHDDNQNIDPTVYHADAVIKTVPDGKYEVLGDDPTTQQGYVDADYAQKRRAAYPSWENQMDMQYWDKVNSTTTWKDAIAAIKTQFPKP
jgi:hypothetical protein